MVYGFDVIVESGKVDRLMEELIKVGVEVKCVNEEVKVGYVGLECGYVDEKNVGKIEDVLMMEEFDGVRGNFWE